MPSRGEGFGLVYLQAMRAGIPCLGSRDDAAADVIVDGDTGLLVPIEARFRDAAHDTADHATRDALGLGALEAGVGRLGGDFLRSLDGRRGRVHFDDRFRRGSLRWRRWRRWRRRRRRSGRKRQHRGRRRQHVGGHQRNDNQGEYCRCMHCNRNRNRIPLFGSDLD